MFTKVNEMSVLFVQLRNNVKKSKNVLDKTHYVVKYETLNTVVAEAK